GLRVPHPPRGDQGGPLGGGPGTQAAGGPCPPATAGPAAGHPGRTTSRTAPEAGRAQGRRGVRAPLSGRAAPARRVPTSGALAGQPRVAAPPRAAPTDGGGLWAVRSPVPDGHGDSQAGRVAGPAAAVQTAADGLEETAVAGAGEGAGVPG